MAAPPYHGHDPSVAPAKHTQTRLASPGSVVRVVDVVVLVLEVVDVDVVDVVAVVVVVNVVVVVVGAVVADSVVLAGSS